MIGLLIDHIGRAIFASAVGGGDDALSVGEVCKYTYEVLTGVDSSYSGLDQMFNDVVISSQTQNVVIPSSLPSHKKIDWFKDGQMTRDDLIAVELPKEDFLKLNIPLDDEIYKNPKLTKSWAKTEAASSQQNVLPSLEAPAYLKIGRQY